MHIVHNHMYICVSLYVQITEELLKLQKEQKELQSKLNLRVIGLSLFATVLEQLQPLCVAEQKFLTSFFHFQKPEKEEEEEGESAGSQVCGRDG